ncbi:DMT family transporter [Lysinibacillus sp. NPDC097195]|uniref:DMT family transporter n=1 Tax=Lysinibacillus sp. NPDC097195 TaxID=3364141 RepID=UPI003807729F
MKAFGFLLIAIASEVFASSMLKQTAGFKRLLPTLGVVIGYGSAFYFLSLTLQSLQIGTAYAIWAGLGTALTAVVGVVFYKENFNVKKFVGILLIIIGVVVLNLAGGSH